MSESARPSTWTAERALRDVAWVAKFLNVSTSWVYKAAGSGVLPVVRIGALLRFDARAIEAWSKGGRETKSVQLPSCR